ncbi:MAG: hypothetical protein ACOC1O_04110 [bacterium]
MKGIKEKGKKELESFRNRVFRQKGLNRISQVDFEELISKVDGLMEYVEEMEETDDKPYID